MLDAVIIETVDEEVVRALLRTGGELLFCGHHAREHGPGLRDIGAALSPSP